MGAKTKPEVFIIESLRLSDEKERLQEGDLISRMLHLAEKSGTQYFYIRTKRELDHIIDEFDQSGCRYLHISCHADRRGMATTFDDIRTPNSGRCSCRALLAGEFSCRPARWRGLPSPARSFHVPAAIR